MARTKQRQASEVPQEMAGFQALRITIIHYPTFRPGVRFLRHWAHISSGRFLVESSRRCTMATLFEPTVVKPRDSGFVLHMPGHLKLTEDNFFHLCGANRACGSSVPPRETQSSCHRRGWMPLNGMELGGRSDRTRATLPNGAVRSPDASWILKTRLTEVRHGAVKLNDFWASRRDNWLGLQSRDSGKLM